MMKRVAEESIEYYEVTAQDIVKALGIWCHDEDAVDLESYDVKTGVYTISVTHTTYESVEIDTPDARETFDDLRKGSLNVWLGSDAPLYDYIVVNGEKVWEDLSSRNGDALIPEQRGGDCGD